MWRWREGKKTERWKGVWGRKEKRKESKDWMQIKVLKINTEAACD